MDGSRLLNTLPDALCCPSNVLSAYSGPTYSESVDKLLACHLAFNQSHRKQKIMDIMDYAQHPSLRPETSEWSGPINPVKAKALGKQIAQWFGLFSIILIWGVLTIGFIVQNNNYKSDQALLDISSLPACATEDSTNCYWNAAANGNGQGQDFINIDGETYYLAG